MNIKSFEDWLEDLTDEQYTTLNIVYDGELYDAYVTKLSTELKNSKPKKASKEVYQSIPVTSMSLTPKKRLFTVVKDWLKGN